MDAQAIAICGALARQRDDAVKGYGDIVAQQAGDAALKDALIDTLQKRVAELEAELSSLKPKEA